jgi:RNA polymerase sigma-70 factor (ECF subfamily)
MALRLKRRTSKLLAGEEFAAFYERNARGVLAYFARRTFDAETALDLTAETFAQAFLSRGRFRGTEEPEAVAWLFGIASHQLSRYRRRGVAERRAIERLGIETPKVSTGDQERIEELAGNDALRTAARDAMADLSESERLAVQLRIVEELSYAEIAARLSITETAARARTSRGLRNLSKSVRLPEESHA